VLAARVQGWGGAELFAAYDAERRHTAWWHLNASKRHMGVRIQMSELYGAAGDIDSDSAAAVANRQRLGEHIKALGNAENESWGVELGYRYDHSSIICREANAPDIDPITYRPSTWPGSRLPHVFLADGLSIHDKLGLYFTLLVFPGGAAAEAEQAVAGGKIPVKVVAIDDHHAAGIYGYTYLLVRPDQHIAWRGQTLAGNMADIIKTAAGW
jgi:hypothetical protein